jgi:glycosyltransferase involved in cell wall biosynthesis
MTNSANGNQNGNAKYDANYYTSHCGNIEYSRDQVALMNHFRTLATSIVERYAPKRALDVGCAKGLLVEHLRDLGVEAFGIDTSEYALSEVRDDIKPFCKFAAATEPFDGRYDLITCIEVAEHLPEEQAEALIANLCAHADDILFSSTPLDYAEDTHFNVQPRAYWVELFARNGYYSDQWFEPHSITPQAMRFKRLTRPINVVICSKEKSEWAVVRLRILDPLRELEKHGRFNVTYVSAYDTDLPIENLLAADVFVVQREFAEQATSAPFIAAARQLGKVVVFEIDDLLTKTPRSNPVYPYSMRIAGDLIHVAREADFITTSTAPLLEELAEEVADAPTKGHVLRNCVNTEIWGDTFEPKLPAENEPYVVGWFGSPTHDEDLAIVKDAIAYLARKHAGEVEFHFFGYLPKELREIPGVKLMRGSQPNVVKHAAGVRAARIDLAIAPLVDNAFNRSKSDLKWLEYSICGIPAIFSDVAPYREAITPGVDGWIVKNDTASWVGAIERLLRDDEARLALAKNAFDTVRGKYCIDVAAERWDALYRSFVVSGPREKVVDADDTAVSKAVARLLVAQARFQANSRPPSSRS